MLTLHMWVVIVVVARGAIHLVREMWLLLRALVVVRLWGCIASHWGAWIKISMLSGNFQKTDHLEGVAGRRQVLHTVDHSCTLGHLVPDMSLAASWESRLLSRGWDTRLLAVPVHRKGEPDQD